MGDSWYAYQNELGKASFQHDMANGDFKELTRRTASNKILRDKPFDIAKNPKYDGYQHGLVSMVCNFFDKKLRLRVQINLLVEKLKIWICLIKNQQKNYNICGADITDMQLINSFNKGIRFLCVIDIFSRHAWVIPFKDKRGIKIINAFQKNLEESNRKPNKICADKDSEWYHRSMKSWLEKMA